METAKMIIDRDYTLSSTDENLFCSFVEPLGRCTAIPAMHISFQY